MKSENRLGLLLLRLSVLALLCVCCGGCYATKAASPLCPMPSRAQVDSWERLVMSGVAPAHVRYHARLIGYCFPYITPLELDDA